MSVPESVTNDVRRSALRRLGEYASRSRQAAPGAQYGCRPRAAAAASPMSYQGSRKRPAVHRLALAEPGDVAARAGRAGCPASRYSPTRATCRRSKRYVAVAASVDGGCSGFSTNSDDARVLVERDDPVARARARASRRRARRPRCRAPPLSAPERDVVGEAELEEVVGRRSRACRRRRRRCPIDEAHVADRAEAIVVRARAVVVHDDVAVARGRPLARTRGA